MELYLFFHQVDLGGNVDTLYKIRLPSFPISEVDTKVLKENLSPILELPKGKYPFSMGSVHLDSKIYFFGGFSCNPYDIEHNIANAGRDFTALVYPCDAYVLDLTHNDLVLNKIPSMKTGKPETFGFVAGGMIYAVGGKVPRWGCKFSDKNIVCFERYDPAHMTWEVLDDTPLRRLGECVGASVVENQHKVLITGYINRDLILLIYDYVHGRWDPEHLFISRASGQVPYTVSHITACNFNGHGHYLYGLRYAAPCPHPVKLGPLKELEIKQISKLSLVDVSSHDGQNIQCVFHRIGCCDVSKVVYLSDGYFCYVGARQFQLVNFPDHLPGPCPQIRNMSLTIFKDLSNLAATQQKGFPFEAKFLCMKDYVMNTNYYGSFEIGGCFVVGGHDC